MKVDEESPKKHKKPVSYNNYSNNFQAQPPKKPKKEAGALSQDFASFDILWFDLVTKTRSLVSDLTQPLVDKVHSNKDLLSQIMK